MDPIAKLSAVDCKIIMLDYGTVVTTFRVTGTLTVSDRVAVMYVVPATVPVTKPVGEIFATDGQELVQVTWELMSSVDPSV